MLPVGFEAIPNKASAKEEATNGSDNPFGLLYDRASRKNAKTWLIRARSVALKCSASDDDCAISIVSQEPTAEGEIRLAGRDARNTNKRVTNSIGATCGGIGCEFSTASLMILLESVAKEAVTWASRSLNTEGDCSTAGRRRNSVKALISGGTSARLPGDSRKLVAALAIA